MNPQGTLFYLQEADRFFSADFGLLFLPTMNPYIFYKTRINITNPSISAIASKLRAALGPDIPIGPNTNGPDNKIIYLTTVRAPYPANTPKKPPNTFFIILLVNLALFYRWCYFIQESILMAIITPIIKDTTPTNIQLKLIIEIVIEKTQSKPATIGEAISPKMIPKKIIAKKSCTDLFIEVLKSLAYRESRHP